MDRIEGEVEVEEEEEEMGLKGRQSRRVSLAQKHHNGNVSLTVAEEENLIADEIQPKEISEAENSIYFDTKDGIWKCRHCTWTYRMESPEIDQIQNSNGHCHGPMSIKTLTQQGSCFGLEIKGAESSNGSDGMKFSPIDGFVAEKKLGNGESEFTINDPNAQRSLTTGNNNQICQNLKDERQSGLQLFSPIDGFVAEKKLGNGESEFTINDPNAQRSLTTGNNNQICQNLKDERQSGLQLLLSEKSIENGSTSSDGITESAHTEIAKESKQEIVEWDVDKVLKEQDTHDLYCPKCKSCITKRVILRKRKRRNPNTQYGDIKREKTDDSVVQVSLDDIPSESELPTSDQGQNIIESGSESGPRGVETEDQDRGTGPDIFRCLSCFSLFSRTVSGFKLWIFGSRGGATLRSSLQIPDGNSAVHDVSQDNHTNELVNSNTEKQEDITKLDTLKANEGALISSEHEALSPQDGRAGFEKDLEGSSKNNGVGNGSLQDNHKLELVNSNTGKKEDNSNREHLKDEKDIEDEALLPQDGLAGDVKDLEGSPKYNGAEIDVLQDNDKAKLVNSYTGKQQDKSKWEASKDKRDFLNSSEHEVLPLQDREVVFEKDFEGSPKYSGAENDVSQENQKDELVKSNNTRKQEDNSEPYVPISSIHEPLLPQGRRDGKDLDGLPTNIGTANDVILDMPGPSQSMLDNNFSPAPETLTDGVTEPLEGQQNEDGSRRFCELDILKSIVYGGLIESITSLGVVSSAAGGDASTMNIVALGLSNLVGGLFIIVHGLRDLKNEQQHGGTTDQNSKVDHYQEVLGHRMNFHLHATIAVLSYLVFGLVPPVTYGFSFHKNNNKEYKLMAVAATSLICIVLLAIGKVYVRKPPKSYIKTILYFLSIGVAASGLSYIVGVLIIKLLEKLGLSEQSSAVLAPPALLVSNKPAWASY